MATEHNFLESMTAHSQERLDAARDRVSPGALQAKIDGLPAPPDLRLSDGFDVFAELKQRSPALGALAGFDFDRRRRAVDYAHGGAAAVSVLTEPARFGGALEHLGEVADVLTASKVPAMRKDFLIDPYQLLEARAHGAGGVLLIVAMLDDAQLLEMLDCAATLGLFCLIEAFDEVDLDRCGSVLAGRDAASILLGVNTRDLKTLEVDMSRLKHLVDRIPAGFPKVAESGVGSPGDAARMATLGYQAVLVGTALMRSQAPAELLATMLERGRAAAQ